MGSHKRKDARQEAAKKEEKRAKKLVKTIKWKDQLEEKNLGVEPLLFNGEGKYGRKRSRQRGRDKQAGAEVDKGPLDSQDSS